LRNSIAIKLVLGLGLFLALFFAAAGMSFWQAEAVDKKTEAIVQVLLPKTNLAYEMEINSNKTKIWMLEYIENPSPVLRAKNVATSSQFERYTREYLRLANADEIANVSTVLDEMSIELISKSATLMNQADAKKSLSESLDQDFRALDRLALIDISSQMELRKSYGLDKLPLLQIMQTEIAEINSEMGAYLRSPNLSSRDEISSHSKEFYESISRFNGMAVTAEEAQRAESLEAMFRTTEISVTQLLDLKDSLDENLAAFLDQLVELDGILRKQVIIPVHLQMADARDAVHSIDAQTNRVTLTLLIVGIGLVFGGTLMVFSRISHPVNKLVEASNKVTAGDLSARVEVISNDEIGLLGAAFNEMVANREQAESALVLSEEQQRRLADENAVNATIGRIVNSSLHLDDVYDAFTQEVRTVVRFDWLAISILDRELEHQRIDYVSEQLVPYLRRGTSLGLKGSFVGAVVEHRACLVETFDDQDAIEGKYLTVSPIAQAGFHSILGVPLFSRDRVIGALVFASAEKIPYSESETAVARNVAEQVAGAIANAQIYAERQEAQTELLRAHDELENRVLERTLELEKTRDIAEEATRAKSQFLATMSHELRTPLNAVIGYSELLIDEATEANNTASIPDLERIIASGKHLLTLVNDILDLARVEAGKMDLFIEEFSISSVVEEVRVVSETLISKNRNKLTVDCPANIGSMQTDQVKIRQMLFNLLSNAGKFTEHGKISMRVDREAIDGVDSVIFTVADTGIGMTPAVAKKLFQPFTQADSSTVRKYGGSGLGLSLCRSFSHMMGGTITLHTTLGMGSTFVISLPATIDGPELDLPNTSGAADEVPDSISSVAEEIKQRIQV